MMKSKDQIWREIWAVHPEAFTLYYLHPDGTIRLFGQLDGEYRRSVEADEKIFPNPPPITPELLEVIRKAEEGKSPA